MTHHHDADQLRQRAERLSLELRDDGDGLFTLTTPRGFCLGRGDIEVVEAVLGGIEEVQRQVLAERREGRG